MPTEELIEKILISVAEAHILEKIGQHKTAEETLRTIQHLWRYERPLPLHTQN